MIIAPLLMNITLCLHSLLVTEEVCSLVDLMKRMMRKENRIKTIMMKIMVKQMVRGWKMEMIMLKGIKTMIR